MNATAAPSMVRIFKLTHWFFNNFIIIRNVTCVNWMVEGNAASVCLKKENKNINKINNRKVFHIVNFIIV
jgi:hypothetical protein